MDKKQITLRLKEEVIDQLDQQASKDKRSRNNYIETLLAKTFFKKPKAPPQPNTKEREVFDYYVKKHKRTGQYQFRPEKITIRLEEYGVDILKKCIDLCAASSFHMGDNSTQTKYNDLYAHILAPSKIDKWVSQAQQGKKSGGGYKW